MIQSMMAFARQEKRGDWGSASCEIRTTNHRYLELFFRLPDNFSFLEPQLRNLLRQHLQRGKFECVIRFQADAAQITSINFNKALVEHLINVTREIEKSAGLQTQINLLDILRWPGVVQNQDIDLSAAQTAILSLFQETIQELIQTRMREGEALQTFLLQRVQEISLNIDNIRSKLPQLNEAMRTKLLARCAELNTSLDPQRFEQEMVLYLQKIDVAEEIDRIATHLNEVTRTFSAGGMIGRRLDFLMQELNREINTLGAKINDSDISRTVVDLKVLLEQMREQIQNIE
jgi:uncharacterized protein (TIGR00255 family)